MLLATKLSSALVTTSKVANLLDWHKAVGSVMSLDISMKSIGVAVSLHPEQHNSICGESSTIPLRPILLHRNVNNVKRNLVTKNVIHELETEIKRHRVCALIVNWPVHEGRMGEECGRALHVLDSVIDKSHNVISRKRPFALWTNNNNNDTRTISGRNHCDCSVTPPIIDEWGRSATFACAPEYSPDMSYSSKNKIKQYSSYSSNSSSTSVVAATILEQWVRTYWEVDSKLGRVISSKKSNHGTYFFNSQAVNKRSESIYLQATLL